MGSGNGSSVAQSRNGNFSPKDFPVPTSVLRLMKNMRQGGFTERQRTSLAEDEAMGSYYKGLMNCEPQVLMFLQTKQPDLYFKYAACASVCVCNEEFSKWVGCVQATGDPRLCHEFKEAIERCGTKMSQRMLRAALADDWF
ncbi:unnamed protein product [Discosporangium mesarthrocarpum]